MQVRDRLYINGQWTAPTGNKAIDVINASTEEVMGRVPEGAEADVNAAVAAARAAFNGWAATPAAERAEFLQKIHEGLKARMEEIGKLIAGEVGMPVKLATMIQAGSPTATFGMYAKMLGNFAFEEKTGNSLILREPVGVVAAITPWNYPLHQIAAKVAPALAAGCTVVLKPSEVAPLNAFVLAEIIHAAGLPAGVFNLVTGYGPVVGEAMARHPDVDMVSFTGSTRAGKRVSELASATVKRVALELGGKSASVVLDDADLAAAVKGTVNTCFLNSGQTCSAHTRLLVPESKYDEAAKIAVEVAKGFTVGDPFGGTAKLGPLVSELQRERVRGYIKKGIEGGAQLLTGGPDAPEGLPKGYYVKPTIFGRVKPDATIAQEEIFGPVLSIITYKDEDEAVKIANGTPYGLGGGVWSKDEERAKKVAKRMRTGQVDINGGPFNPQAPFGGFKQSGNGRELGRFGLEEFLEYKSLQLKPEGKA
ncbi:MAG: aldehyde dehydrogenase [Betaproteobacteria bacterium RIFCSPLOWO2_12_FULL_62_13b]|nr:MAG: aldehyde dehydrogenase [Betaproteobacteria bacterium RIFCSPLOWO2_12_FULL_62_13b]